VIKILLVEDEPDMLDLTAYVLRRERFVVAEAADGAAALRRWKADRPDIVILDLGLPSVDGFEVLRRIREESDTPVLILTARPKGPDLARAFNLGTDDFLAKPFEFRELIARIRAILRRAKAAHQEVREPKVEANGLVLDPEAYEVTWREQICRLTPTEFRILYLLVTNAGHVVSANRLYTYVWGADGGDANARTSATCVTSSRWVARRPARSHPCPLSATSSGRSLSRSRPRARACRPRRLSRWRQARRSTRRRRHGSHQLHRRNRSRAPPRGASDFETQCPVARTCA